MLQDLLKVNEAEKEANKIIIKAEEDGRNIVKEASEEALKKDVEFKLKAKKEYGDIVEGLIFSGKGELDKVVKEGKIEESNILNLSTEKIDEAVNLILKRVVFNYGNN